MGDNQSLLHQYVEGSRKAFGEIVRRHADLIYSAARRQVRDAHLAEDVTQAVFLVLAQRAGTIRSGTLLAGWLMGVARHVSVDAMRRQSRQHQHEHRAAKPEVPAPTEAAEWDRVAPVLDAALAGLPAADRDAVIMRYYQDRSYAEIGRQLRLSEDGVRKRVDRALAKLRHTLTHRGVTIPAASVTVLLAGNAVQAAPATLIVAINALTPTAAPAAIASLTKGALNMMMWTKLKFAGAIVAVVVFVAASVAVTFAQATRVGSIPPKAGTSSPSSMPSGAATAPATTMELDLSTPKNTLPAMAKAMMAGDKVAVYQCLTVDPARKPTVLDALIDWNLAEHRLIRAQGKAFGPKSPDARTATAMLDYVAVIVYGLSQGPDALEITGDSAVFRPDLPPDMLAKFPPQTPKTMKEAFEAWGQGVLLMRRVDKQWKVDLDGSFRVATGLKGTGDAIKDTETDIALFHELASDLNGTAAKVESGELRNLSEVQKDLAASWQKLPKKYPGFTTTIDIAILPAKVREKKTFTPSP